MRSTWKSKIDWGVQVFNEGKELALEKSAAESLPQIV